MAHWRHDTLVYTNMEIGNVVFYMKLYSIGKNVTVTMFFYFLNELIGICLMRCSTLSLYHNKARLYTIQIHSKMVHYYSCLKYFFVQKHLMVLNRATPRKVWFFLTLSLVC